MQRQPATDAERRPQPATGEAPARRPRMKARRGRGGPNAVDAYVGSRIRQRCRAVGMTQKELAARLGLGYTRLQLYVHGAVRISAGLLHEIARELDAPIDYFYAGLAEGAAEGGQAPGSLLRPEVERKLTTSEANQVVQAFMAIGDENVRHMLLELCERVASNQTEEKPDTLQ